MTDDNLHGIFDNLNPEDFHRTTTAVHERALDFSDDPFERFLDANLTAVRYAFASADGRIFSVATLSDGNIERMFAPQDDENIGQYIGRLHGEAWLMSAKWAFITVRTRVGTVLAGQVENTDVTSTQNLALAESMGGLRDAVYWYAARTDDVDTPRRHGFLLVNGITLGENINGEADQAVPSFDRILLTDD